MAVGRYDGRMFNYEYAYFNKPRRLGPILLVQIGEIKVEPGYGYPQHNQCCHEISYCISGSGTFSSGDEKYKLTAGGIHIIEKGGLHAVAADCGEPLRYAFIGFDFSESEDAAVEKLAEFFSMCEKHFLVDKGEIGRSINKLMNEIYLKPELNEKYLECCLTELFIEIYRLAHDAEDGRSRPSGDGGADFIYSLLRYIDRHIYDIPDLATVSQKFGYNQCYISHVFKEKVGVSMREYIRAKRIESSLEFLKCNEISVEKAAQMMGYESSQSYCKAFKNVMGITPTQYRKALSEGATETNGEEKQ